ncbi:MAG: hydroxyisourate hydrolase [Acidimicrobiia bacterium]
MISISTHVLDTGSGEPASDVMVTLQRRAGDQWTEVNSGTTDDDGRVANLGSDLAPGAYRVRFDTGGYGNRFYPEVVVVVDLDDSSDHYHIPLLLSPFGYSTYRGS